MKLLDTNAVVLKKGRTYHKRKPNFRGRRYCPITLKENLMTVMLRWHEDRYEPTLSCSENCISIAF
jgi:hypothetical protein